MPWLISQTFNVACTFAVARICRKMGHVVAAIAAAVRCDTTPNRKPDEFLEQAPRNPKD